MLSQFEIDFLIVHLRWELENVNRSIVTLERTDETQRAAAAQATKYPLTSHRVPPGRAGRGWSRRCLRAG